MTEQDKINGLIEWIRKVGTAEQVETAMSMAGLADDEFTVYGPHRDRYSLGKWDISPRKIDDSILSWYVAYDQEHFPRTETLTLAEAKSFVLFAEDQRGESQGVSINI